MSGISDRLDAMPPDKRLYALRTLPAHLAGAAQTERLRQILTSVAFLQAKAAALGPEPLIADYELAPRDGGLGLLQGAIRLGAHVLERDGSQLYAQLAGRLPDRDAPAVLEVLGQAPGHPWLRTLKRSLTPPGVSLLRTLAGHVDDVTSVLALADGVTIVSGSRDGTIVVWDAVTGVARRRLGGREPRPATPSGVTALALLPDGVRVVGGEQDGSLRLWDLASGSEVGALPRQEDDIAEVAALPDGQSIVSATVNGRIRVLSLQSGAELYSHQATGGSLLGMTVLADGRIVFAGVMPPTVWSPASGDVSPMFLPEGYTWAVAALPDGRAFLSASMDGKLMIWNAETGFAARTITVTADAAVCSCAALPDGEHALAGTGDGRLELWHLPTGARLRTLASDLGRINSIAVLAGGRLAVTGSDRGVLRVWDLTGDADDRHSIGPAEHRNGVYAVRILPRRRRAVSLALDGVLGVWDAESGEELLTFQLYDAVTSPGGWVMTTLGQDVVVAGSQHGQMTMVELKREGAITHWPAHQLAVTAIAGSPDGKRIISAAIGGELAIWDPNGRQLRTLNVADWGDERRRHVREIVPLLDGRRALAVLSTGGVRLWNVETGALLRTFPEDVSLAAFLPEDALILGLHDGRWCLWELETATLRRTLPAPAEPIRRVLAAPRRQRALTLSQNGVIRLWSLADGAALAGFGADAEIVACSLSPDGSLIVAGDRTGRLHFLRLQDGAASGQPDRSARAARRKWWQFRRQ